jgi:ATP diphosphatase
MKTWSVAQLLDLMQQLRDPETGCPWDKKQTFASVVPHTLEEAYEVASAIETQDFQALPDELGDLLFQVIFYAQLGKEAAAFDFQTICNQLGDKLYRRHPHVFGQSEALACATEVLQKWEEGKNKERQAQAKSSLMDDLPQALPALSLAQKTQKRAASVGFDWQEVTGVRAKILEELAEVDACLAAQEPNARLQEELGDLLFSVVNLARFLGVDAETALRHSQRKFAQRFQHVESCVQASPKDFSEHSEEELEVFWQEAKEVLSGGEKV